MTLDPRLHAFRDDLADEALRGQVSVPRYTRGREAEISVGTIALRRNPIKSDGIDTFLHFGERILVFDEGGIDVWCQSLEDHYVGYTKKNALTYALTERTHYIARMGAYRYSEPDLRSSVIDYLPRHARVSLSGAVFEKNALSFGELKHGGFIPLTCLSEKPPSSKSLSDAITHYLGTPYLWGGKDYRGIDCSGLIQMCCRDLDISFPRDVYMQQAATKPIKSDRGSQKAGDLLFIKSPPHVAVFVSPDDLIHADGLSMMVIRQRLEDFLKIRELKWSDLDLRSLPI